MTYTTRITIAGKKHPISRDVTDTHPDAVHDALGTTSESDLQGMLDGMNVSDWYDAEGNHLGPDVHGLEMFHDDNNDA